MLRVSRSGRGGWRGQRVAVIAPARLVMVLCLALCWGCSKKAPSASKKRAKVVAAELARSPAFVMAEGRVLGAQRVAFRRAMERLTTTLNEQDRKHTVSRPPLKETRHVSIVFGANNHGEREDCGCKYNPLGGLDRRATLIRLAASPGTPEAQKWWGPLEGVGADAKPVLFHADAGDLLFHSTSLAQMDQARRDRSKRQAEAVLKALQVKGMTPDAINVGEQDLALGLDALKGLIKDAPGLPFVSANLRTEAGEAPFPGHRVVERGGVKVAFIGILKDRPRQLSFYANLKLKVIPAREAYAAEVAKLPADVSLVVLLSNMGVKRSQELVRQIHKDQKRVDVVVASNTNRHTRRPRWVEGVPVVEPMSRGKYLGKLDLFLKGEGAPKLMNGREPSSLGLKEYRRTFTSYLDARMTLNRSVQSLHRAQKDLKSAEGELAEREQFWSARAKTKQQRVIKKKELAQLRRRVKNLKARIARTNARMGANVKRITILSERASEEAGTLRERVNPAPDPSADDWLDARVVSVKLALPQDPAVRKVLDRYKDLNTHAKTIERPRGNRLPVPKAVLREQEARRKTKGKPARGAKPKP